jgi:NADPH2:quinone reductase
VVKAVAARLVDHGKPLAVTEVDLPEPRPDEVVVDMLYGGVNPVDRYRAAGSVDGTSPLPRTLGAEGTGTVDGRLVAVFGHGVGTTRDGVWATRVVVPRSALIELPDGIDPRQAAVMGVAGVTAWRTVAELAQVTPSDRVLVMGAGGGVGSIIVSLVHRIGATVWAQASAPSDADRLRALGASEVVGGTADDLAAQVRGLRPTVVFDPLGGGFTGAAIASLVPRGRLVIFGTSAGPTGTVPLQDIYRSGLKILGYGGLRDSDQVLGAALATSLNALASGKLAVAIGQTLPLAQVNEAFELLAAQKVSGKLVLDLRRPPPAG